MSMFIDIARSRKTVRDFSEIPLTEDEISMIMEVGDLAPSSRNLRPVRLFPVRDTGIIRRLAGCKDSGTRALGSATFAVIVAADASVSDVWIEDCSIASIMMQMEAEDLGLGSCWIQVRLRTSDGRPSEDAVKGIAGLDEGLAVHSVMAFGRGP